MAPPSSRAGPGHGTSPQPWWTCRHWSRWPGSSSQAWAAPSEFDTLLALHAGPERMLDQGHFGDEVGQLDQRRMSVAAGDDHVLVGGLFVAQKTQHRFDRQIVVAQHDVELIQQDHAVAIVADQLLGALPAFRRRRDIAFPVLRFPAKAL